MKQFTYAITDPVGLHARPAGHIFAHRQRGPAGTKHGKTYTVAVLVREHIIAHFKASPCLVHLVVAMAAKGGGHFPGRIEGVAEELIN